MNPFDEVIMYLMHFTIQAIDSFHYIFVLFIYLFLFYFLYFLFFGGVGGG